MAPEEISKDSEDGKVTRSVATAAYEKTVTDGALPGAAKTKHKGTGEKEAAMEELKKRREETREMDRLIRHIQKDDWDVVHDLLEQRGEELLRYCFETPDRFRIKDPDGIMLIDTIASYGPPELVKQLLERAKKDEDVKWLIAENHKVDHGIILDTFDLAILTIRDEHEDDAPYKELEKEIRKLEESSYV